MTIDSLRFCEAAESRWRRPVADMLLSSKDHLSAAEALRESAHRPLAPGTAVVAPIVALRVAVTPSLVHDEFAGKWDALGTYPRCVDPLCRGRLDRLLEAARQI